MHKLLFSIGLLYALSACATDAPAFHRMSSEEIAAYNDSVEFQDQIICMREIRIGTHIKRRYCETFADMENRMLSNIGKLNSANLGAPVTYTTN